MTDHNEEYYRQKYLKYKAKYLALQEQSGSGFASAIKAFLSLNGTYLIFHRFTEFDKINEFMEDYIPIDNNKKNVKINRTILGQFDQQSNKKILEHIFNDSIIVHIYKPLLSSKHHIEIAEFGHYLSERAKLDFNLTEYLQKNNLFKTKDVAEILKQINNNDVEILTKIQNFCIGKLNTYYHNKIQSSGTGKPKISLFDYYQQKYPNIQNYITDYDQLPDNILLFALANTYMGPPILSSVFIMDNVKHGVLAVNFDIRNVKLIN